MFFITLFRLCDLDNCSIINKIFEDMKKPNIFLTLICSSEVKLSSKEQHAYWVQKQSQLRSAKHIWYLTHQNKGVLNTLGVIKKCARHTLCYAHLSCAECLVCYAHFHFYSALPIASIAWWSLSSVVARAQMVVVPDVAARKQTGIVQIFVAVRASPGGR